ncbi:hypothetical protein QBC36DRAFT_291840 [Triangularia setosa]|uniref:Protein kinase domain-containing protein n=1 Tax=Triangularia setosa TaxID=2587417 RepID=A0AAN6W7P0_9PEZI|nr:hypothetical protein QBC36DRAFT_291840 [Podospora setosa]
MEVIDLTDDMFRTATAGLEDGTKPKHPAQNNDRPFPTTIATAFNFLATLGSPFLEICDPVSTGVLGYQQIHAAGHGGYVVIEVSLETAGKAVAVKRSRMLAGMALGRAFDRRDDALFWRHFEQLTLELRVLSHTGLYAHANTITLLGVCIDEVDDATDLGLILELFTLGAADLSTGLLALRC